MPLNLEPSWRKGLLQLHFPFLGPLRFLPPCCSRRIPPQRHPKFVLSITQAQPISPTSSKSCFSLILETPNSIQQMDENCLSSMGGWEVHFGRQIYATCNASHGGKLKSFQSALEFAPNFEPLWSNSSSLSEFKCVRR